jgi:hemolysin activation/secretion protein
MRIVLTTALLLAATFAWADEPNPAEAKPTPAAAEAQATANDEQAPATEEKPAATEQTAAEAAPAEQPATEATKDEDKPFKVPAGYRAKRINGKQMYCTSSGAVTGARLSGKEQCRTEDQLRAIEKRKAEMEQR